MLVKETNRKIIIITRKMILIFPKYLPETDRPFHVTLPISKFWAKNKILKQKTELITAMDKSVSFLFLRV
jgi:hypothetical protein